MKDEDGQALMDESMVINVHDQELIRIFLNKPVLDDDGDQKKGKNGDLKWETYPMANVVKMATEFIGDNVEDIQDTAMWMARQLTWSGHQPLYCTLISFYLGVIVGQNKMKIKIEREYTDKETLAELISKAIRAKADALNELADDVRGLLGVDSDDQLLLPGKQ